MLQPRPALTEEAYRAADANNLQGPAPQARAVDEVHARYRRAIEGLLSLLALPHPDDPPPQALAGLPADVQLLLLEVLRHGATLPSADPFPGQEEFDEFVRQAPAVSEAELTAGLQRLPRDTLEGLAVYFAVRYGQTESTAQQLQQEHTQITAKYRRDTLRIATRAAEERAQRDQLLDAKTARIGELQARLSAFERERQEAEGIIRRLEEAALPPPPVAPASDEAD